MVVSSVHRRFRQALLLSTALGCALALPSLALGQSLPTNGSVAAGSVTITQPSATQLDITQSSQSAVVDWQGFSIGQGSAVTIVQPDANSALLNRVTGDTPSTIAGSLTANGQVYLVNPNGIAITSTGTVNTGAFVASSLGISDTDFMNGKRTFTGNGASAAVSNAGTITAAPGGYAALIGGTVSNSGSIIVPLGEVGLGSGEQATLDFSGDGFLQVAIPTKAGGSDALIQNAGTIKANGGSVIISAATAREAARDAVNISGLVEARSIGGRSGSIVIGGGNGGAVKISGRLSVRGRTGRGGSITVTGQHIALDGAHLNASGKTGGGSINIGGGAQGTGSLQQADTTSIDATTAIDADAIASGNGGNVVIWSDMLTSFAGTISATGGSIGGNGGEAEVSSHGVLDYTGFTNLMAANGGFGTLLLDPYDVVISDGTSNTGGSFDANTADSVINVATLEAALSGANVTITTGSGGSQAGNITVADPLAWSSGSLLTLSAANAIAIDAPITVAGGGQLALNYSTSALSNLSFGTGGDVTFAQNADQATQALSINGQAYTLIRSMADLDGIDGTAASGNAINTQAGGVSGFYALAGGLDASGTTYTDALVGTSYVTPFSGTFEGLGHTIAGLTINKSSDYAGLFGFVDGGTVRDIGLIGGTVSGTDDVGDLVGQNRGTVAEAYATGSVIGTGSNVGGLVGSNNSIVTNAYATGAVSGVQYVGGLVGYGYDGTISQAYASGAVSGTEYIGGLAGYSYGTIAQSYATGAVSGGSVAGGLVGDNDGGTITQAYATGAVSGGVDVGGLVGLNDTVVPDGGAITEAYATGAVRGIVNVGGLVGVNEFGSITQAYATGQNGGTSNVGGLVGWNYGGSITQAYATGQNSGTSNVGGLVGWNYGGSIAQAYATGAVDGSVITVGLTNSNAGGLVGQNYYGTIAEAYATGAVTGPSDVGGLVGYNNGTIASGYYDVGTTGRTNGIGFDTGSQSGNVAGLTTAQFQSGVLPTGFDSSVWATGSGLYPYLTNFFPNGVEAIAGTALNSAGAAASGAQVGVYADGTLLGGGTGSVGANGYFYEIVGAGTLPASNASLGETLTLAGASSASGVAYSDAANATGSKFDLGVLSVGVDRQTTAETSYSALQADLGQTFGADTYTALQTAVRSAATDIAATGESFTLDTAVRTSAAFTLTSRGDLIIAPSGQINSSASGDAIVLATGGNFINDAGANAVEATNTHGRWLIYSNDAAGDKDGGLTSAFNQYFATYGVTPVAQASGNGFLYALPPALTPGHSFSPAQLGSSVADDAPGNDGPAGFGPIDLTFGDSSAPGGPMLVFSDPRFGDSPADDTRKRKPKGH